MVALQLEQVIMKTHAAFSNGQGGILIIGVNEYFSALKAKQAEMIANELTNK